MAAASGKEDVPVSQADLVTPRPRRRPNWPAPGGNRGARGRARAQYWASRREQSFLQVYRMTLSAIAGGPSRPYRGRFQVDRSYQLIVGGI